MAYSFVSPGLVISGPGSLDDLVLHLSGHGHSALLVAGRSASRNGVTERVMKALEGLKIESHLYNGVTEEPTARMVEEGAELFRSLGCDFLIAAGGGSQIDAMKAIALVATSGGSIQDYAAGEGSSGLTVSKPPFMVAVPTTAGTGSEATRFTIITDGETKRKIASDLLIPDLAVLDPELTLSMPERVTVSSGLDALTHAVEAYTSRKAQPLSDAYALSAVKRIFGNIARAADTPGDLEARTEMQLAALEAGVAFNNSSVTIVHGMSRPVGALFHVPHGMSNAILLPSCLAFAESGAVRRFADLGRAVGAASSVTPDAKAADRFVEAVRLLVMKLGVPSLEKYGIAKGDFIGKIDRMTEDAMTSGSPQLTAREVSADDVRMLYRNLWPEQISMEG